MSLASIVTVPTSPTLDPADLSWRNVLQDSLALIDAEIWDEERSEHPGSKHRLKVLQRQRGDRRLQLALLGVEA